MALAHSRLWDAVSGFLHIFDCLQKQLYRHTSHVELLREMLDLQEVFFILLLSLLEGQLMSTYLLSENEQYISILLDSCVNVLCFYLQGALLTSVLLVTWLICFRSPCSM